MAKRWWLRSLGVMVSALLLRSPCLVAEENDSIDAIPSAEPTENTDFCGPHFFQYTVHSERGLVGGGVRCVRFDGKRMMWYGEGQWGQAPRYRHMGVAEFERARDANGSAVAIGAQHANAGGPFDKTLRFEFTYGGDDVPVIIHENGTWNETWHQDPHSGYLNNAPMATTPCGTSDLTTAYVVTSPGQSQAIRCVPNAPIPVWFGQGYWLGRPYLHLGVLENTQNWTTPGNLYGAAFGICAGQQGTCEVSRPLELMEMVGGEIFVTGDVNENWRRSNSSARRPDKDGAR